MPATNRQVEAMESLSRRLTKDIEEWAHRDESTSMAMVLSVLSEIIVDASQFQGIPKDIFLNRMAEAWDIKLKWANFNPDELRSDD